MKGPLAGEQAKAGVFPFRRHQRPQCAGSVVDLVDKVDLVDGVDRVDAVDRLGSPGCRYTLVLPGGTLGFKSQIGIDFPCGR